MACTFDFGLNGLDSNFAGLPTRLQVYVRMHGTCTRVRLTVRQHQGDIALFSDEVVPDSNGTCVSEFPLTAAIFPCGFGLWVEAICLSGDTCSHGSIVTLSCKQQPDGQSGDPNDPGNGHSGNGGGDWPWRWPPALFCPLMGRTFTTALLIGLMAVVAGVAFLQPAAVAAGGAIIVGAFAIYAIWMHWCSVSYCNYWGAILWVLKRGVIASVVLTFIAASVSTFLLGLVLGVATGILTQLLRARRCRLPSARISLQELPLW